MSLPIDDGGPAFPQSWKTQPKDEPATGGMSLRDYFAAKAMQATLSCTDDKSEWPHPDECAPAFYAWADAMLKARKANG